MPLAQLGDSHGAINTAGEPSLHPYYITVPQFQDAGPLSPLTEEREATDGDNTSSFEDDSIWPHKKSTLNVSEVYKKYFLDLSLIASHS